jgi:CubicO group peptidase (beta-lactamase class C family)
MKNKLHILLFLIVISGCSKNDGVTNTTMVDEMYFPELNSDHWETISSEELNWNSSAIENLYDFLSQNNTRAFIVLKNGRIVLENYWGNNLQNTAAFDRNTNWYWASAGKTLTALLTGIAQENGLLSIEDKSAMYLGNGWTSLSESQEGLIKIKHQLTMTTGLDYEVDNLNCTEPNCLTYKNPPGTEWFYHNATYTLLTDIIENASQTSYNTFSDQNIEFKIGMNGNWIKSNYNTIYWSTARDMARFGLLILNQGTWKEDVILKDMNYFSNMTNTSQELNESYGYLWWLNGKNSFILPGFTTPVNSSLASNAPQDLIAGMGKNGQFVVVVPNQNIVVIRMGEAPGDFLVPINFHNEMWTYLNEIIN